MIVKFSHPHYLKIDGRLHARLPASRVTPKFLLKKPLLLPLYLLLTNAARNNIYRRDGIAVRESASQSVDFGFFSQVESYQKTLENGIHSFHACRLA